jgi:anti-sigma factor RsiW
MFPVLGFLVNVSEARLTTATSPMRQQLREAWSKLITAEDYEAHMVAVGQAQANAALVCEYLQAHPPAPDSALLFAGAGTGQMFDFFSPETVLPFNVTFTEINAGYLNRLRTRLARFPGLRYAIFVDDLERTALAKPFDLALPVLVLQHVDWHPAVLTLCPSPNVNFSSSSRRTRWSSQQP